MKRVFIPLYVLLLLSAACSKQSDHNGKTPLVEVSGHFLYREDLQSAIPHTLNPSDSLQFAEYYIRNWTEEMLLLQVATHNVSDNHEINTLVENYRKNLIIHTYQQALISQQLSKEISEQELTDYYEKNREQFHLEFPLLKGLFIKVPLTAPRLNDVRRWYKLQNQDAVDNLEKYSLQNAVKYEYFYDKWVPLSNILDLIPLDVPNAEEFLNNTRQVEIQDSAYCYFLNVSDFRGTAAVKPYEYARSEVMNMLLNLKQVQFMTQVKSDLYERALRRNEIIYY
ncbi:MAG: peptidyl-prolyl cis-trans isomerase [Prevotellaceae bacterium]|jgi:hypothetical protein|nr:peptidyl-prolyl cis-trans isomerase [Prevotellaceae bacterium]